MLHLNIFGLDAIRAVIRSATGNAGPGSIRLWKHADPLQEARIVNYGEAARIACEDPLLIELVADVRWYGNEHETIAVCGIYYVIVQSPDLRDGEGYRVVEDKRPDDVRPIKLEADHACFNDVVVDAIRNVVQAWGKEAEPGQVGIRPRW